MVFLLLFVFLNSLWEVKDVRLKWSNASQSTKIVDKIGVMWGFRCTFQDTFKVLSFGICSRIQKQMRVKMDSDGSQDLPEAMVMNRILNDYRIHKGCSHR